MEHENAQQHRTHSQNSMPTANLVLPRQKAKPVSHRPAIMSIIQFIMDAKVRISQIPGTVPKKIKTCRKTLRKLAAHLTEHKK